jgi:hypothetical protein
MQSFWEYRFSKALCTRNLPSIKKLKEPGNITCCLDTQPCILTWAFFQSLTFPDQSGKLVLLETAKMVIGTVRHKSGWMELTPVIQKSDKMWR